MTFPPWGNSDLLLSKFPSTSHQTQNGMTHFIVQLMYSHAEWDDLLDHLRDVPWEYIIKLGASAAASEFCEWVQAGIPKFRQACLEEFIQAVYIFY